MEIRKFVRAGGGFMKRFVKVVSNYCEEANDFADNICIQEELIPVKNLIKVYKYKCEKPMLAYVWRNPVSGILTEWFQIFHSEKQRDTLFDKLEKRLCC
jgi:hypothetical protein